MKNLFQRLAFYFMALTTAWLIILGLIVGGLVLQLKALLVALAPVIGPAWSLAVVGFTCLALVFGIALVLWRSSHSVSVVASGPLQTGVGGEEKEEGSAYEAARVVMQKYPLEAVAVAFALGLSANDSRDLKKSFLFVLREFQ